MNIPNWNQRSIFTANLLNPAFCGEILKRSLLANSKFKNNDEFSFAMTFFILPLVLYKKTRDRLPKTKRTKLHDWLSQNEDLKIDLISRIKYLVPYTRESIIFLYKHDKLEFTNSGNLLITAKKNKLYSDNLTTEVEEILNKADFLGKWMSTFPEDKVAYSFFGIMP